MPGYRLVCYQSCLLRLLPLAMVLAMLYQTSLIAKMRTQLLLRDFQHEESRKGRKYIFFSIHHKSLNNLWW